MTRVMSLDQPVHRLFQQRARSRVSGDIGIEIETEFRRDTEPRLMHTDEWISHSDGSLRNGMEYVFQQPLPLKKIPDALKSFSTLTKSWAFEQSIRTSVHVHVNVSRMPVRKTLSAISAYWLLEDALVRTQGKYRVGNLFCLRARDAESVLRTLQGDIASTAGDQQQANWSVFSDRYRYLALNLAAMRKFGSLEFRFLRGTTNTDEIQAWTEVFYQIIHSGSEIPVEEQITLVAQNRAEELIDRVLSKSALANVSRFTPVNFTEADFKSALPRSVHILEGLERYNARSKYIRPFIVREEDFDETATLSAQGINLRVPIANELWATIPRPRPRTDEEEVFWCPVREGWRFRPLPPRGVLSRQNPFLYWAYEQRFWLATNRIPQMGPHRVPDGQEDLFDEHTLSIYYHRREVGLVPATPVPDDGLDDSFDDDIENEEFQDEDEIHDDF